GGRKANFGKSLIWVCRWRQTTQGTQNCNRRRIRRALTLVQEVKRMLATRMFLVSAIVLAEALALHFFLAHRFPLSGDGYSYLYQAKLFASGKLYAEDPIYDPAQPFYDCVETSCLRDDQGHRFSKYPPGWPVFLAVGVKLDAPWLVDPLLGALLVFF